MKEDVPIRNISRHTTQESTGWYVRMRSLGRVKRKYFSDRAYGSKQDSLEAAIKYRNKLAKTQRDGRFLNRE